MTVRLTRFLQYDEYVALNDWAISHGYYRDDHRIFQPGWAWYEPWYWDPVLAKKCGITPDMPYWEVEAILDPLGKYMYGGGRATNHSFLSKHYWERWSQERSPVCIVLPNGQQWEIDRKSSNGEGWIVTGTWPNITCEPSIKATGYHGFLQNGVFTKDCERPGHPDGVYPYPVTWKRKLGNETYEIVPGNPPPGYCEQRSWGA